MTDDDQPDQKTGAERTVATRPPAAVAEVWDAERELVADRHTERRLLVREGLILALVAGLIALRVLFVHGGY